MTIMVLLMAMTLSAYLNWGRGTEMRGSALNIRSALSLARQWAVTHGERTTFHCTNTGSAEAGCYAISTWEGNIGNTSCLAKGILFSSDSAGAIEFVPDGSCEWEGAAWSNDEREIVLVARDTGLSSTLMVSRLTG